MAVPNVLYPVQALVNWTGTTYQGLTGDTQIYRRFLKKHFLTSEDLETDISNQILTSILCTFTIINILYDSNVRK